MKKLILLIFVTMLITSAIFAQEWIVKDPMPTAISASGGAAVNDTIYVIGGWNDTNEVGTVEAYCTNTNTWTTKRPMPTARGELGVAVVKGKIYAIGGYNGSAVNIVEEYDPVANSWTTKASMPTACSEVYCGAIGNNIYVVGGWPGGTNILQIYNTVTDTWSNGTSIDTGKESNNSCAILNSQLYIIDGKNNLTTTFYNTNESFDTTTHSWNYHSPCPQAVYEGSAAVLNNEIHYLGGADGDNIPNYNNHYVYNSVSNLWTSALPMLHKRSAHVAVTVNRLIYVIGGYDSTGSVVNWNEEYCDTCSNLTDVNAFKINTLDKVQIYPNPTSGIFTVSLDESGYTRIKIYDVFGREVYAQPLGVKEQSINLNVPNGTYIIQIITQNSVISKRIIIDK